MNLGQTSNTSEEFVTLDGHHCIIDKYNFIFDPWPEHHNLDTYGGKQILKLENEPLFAELVILRLLEKQGYQGVWVDTYRNKFWRQLPCLSIPVEPDKLLLDVIDKIYLNKGGRRSGCFDIIAYRDTSFVFAELKKCKADRIRQSPIEWFMAAQTIGLDNPRFFIAEWTI